MPTKGYQNRRGSVVDGKLTKSWINPPPADWFVAKADAIADDEKTRAEAKVRDDALAAKKGRTEAEISSEASSAPGPERA